MERDSLVELEDTAKQAGFQVIAAVAAIAEHQAVKLPHLHKNVIKSFHAGITITFLVQSCTLIPLIFPVSSRK